jgi:hypothetical protein
MDIQMILLEEKSDMIMFKNEIVVDSCFFEILWGKYRWSNFIVDLLIVN